MVVRKGEHHITRQAKTPRVTPSSMFAAVVLPGEQGLTEVGMQT